MVPKLGLIYAIVILFAIASAIPQPTQSSTPKGPRLKLKIPDNNSSPVELHRGIQSSGSASPNTKSSEHGSTDRYEFKQYLGGLKDLKDMKDYKLVPHPDFWPDYNPETSLLQESALEKPSSATKETQQKGSNSHTPEKKEKTKNGLEEVDKNKNLRKENENQEKGNRKPTKRGAPSKKKKTGKGAENLNSPQSATSQVSTGSASASGRVTRSKGEKVPEYDISGKVGTPVSAQSPMSLSDSYEGTGVLRAANFAKAWEDRKENKAAFFPLFVSKGSEPEVMFYYVEIGEKDETYSFKKDLEDQVKGEKGKLINTKTGLNVDHVIELQQLLDIFPKEQPQQLGNLANAWPIMVRAVKQLKRLDDGSEITTEEQGFNNKFKNTANDFYNAVGLYEPINNHKLHVIRRIMNRNGFEDPKTKPRLQFIGLGLYFIEVDQRVKDVATEWKNFISDHLPKLGIDPGEAETIGKYMENRINDDHEKCLKYVYHYLTLPHASFMKDMGSFKVAEPKFKKEFSKEEMEEFEIYMKSGTQEGMEEDSGKKRQASGSPERSQEEPKSSPQGLSQIPIRPGPSTAQKGKETEYNKSGKGGKAEKDTKA